MQQAVVVAQVLEQALLRQFSRPGGLVGRKAQRVGVGLVDQLGQAHQVDRAVDHEQGLRRQAELLQQEVGQVGRAGAHHFQAHRLAELARAHLGAQGLAQVGHVVFVHFQVGVARQAELRESLDLAAREELVQVRADDAGQQHEALLPLRHQPLGQGDDAWQHPRDAHDGDVVVAAESVHAAQTHDEIQRLVGDLREGVRGVQADGHQQRAHLTAEEIGHPLTLVGIAVGVVEDEDARVVQLGRHHLVEDLVLIFDQAVRLPRDLGDVGGVDAGAGRARGLDDIGVADFKELVEVGRDDADVTQAFQQRDIFPLGLGQHAAVEFEDGLLAAEQLDAGLVQHLGWDRVVHVRKIQPNNASGSILRTPVHGNVDILTKLSAPTPNSAPTPPRPPAARAAVPPRPSGAARPP